MSVLTSWPEALYLGRRPVLDAACEGFSMTTARALGWASQLANETADAAKLARILADWGWTPQRVFAGRMSSLLPLVSARGFFAECGGAGVLAFAGSEPANLADWIVDLSIRTTPEGVHAGFDAAIESVRDSLVAIGDGAGPLVLAGHSLGGALAMLAAWRLVRGGAGRTNRIRGVYTFGTPRVGDGRFAGLYRDLGLGARTFRLIHGADIVPELPPAEAPFGFRHFGARLSCPHGGMFRAEDLVADIAEAAPPGRANWLGLLRAATRGFPLRDLPGFPGDAAAASVIDKLPAAFRDHVPDRYLRALDTF